MVSQLSASILTPVVESPERSKSSGLRSRNLLHHPSLILVAFSTPLCLATDSAICFTLRLVFLNPVLVNESRCMECSDSSDDDKYGAGPGLVLLVRLADPLVLNEVHRGPPLPDLQIVQI